MTKEQLIAALEPYNDDAQIVASARMRWYELEHVLEYEPITPDHVVIEVGDCVME